MGRSSATCDYQLSSNRLISRVHVTACFKPASSNLKQDQIEITCTGWNGIKVHCRGKAVQLSKGDNFTSCHKGLDVIVDAQDSRICVKWPSKDDTPFSSGSSDEESSPSRHPRHLKRHSTPPSPHRPLQQIASPVSPSPAIQAAPNVSIPSSPPSLLQPVGGPVVVYEDKSISPERSHYESTTVSQTTFKMSQPHDVLLAQSQNSLLSESQDFSDQDEENDPIINQLAFSRLSSTPLSTILSHFPEDAGDCSSENVKEAIAQISCIGEVAREGKDAAGRPLESEYYYIPDEDQDEMRREAVVNDLRKPGLRACRKQHKVCLAIPLHIGC